MKAEIFRIQCALLCMLFSWNASIGSEPLIAEPTGTVTIADAIAYAVLNNPELKVYDYKARAAEARSIQAGRMSNPKLELEVGEYDRYGEGYSSTETVLGIAQVFELGSKRSWRKRVASARENLADMDFEVTKSAIIGETYLRFMTAMAAQQRLELSRSSAELAMKTYEAVKGRVDAGKEPPLQRSKAEAELELAKLDASTAEKSLMIAKEKLAAMWGAEKASFISLDSGVDSIESIPNLESLKSNLSENPYMLRLEDEVKLSDMVLSSEKAERIPDLRGSIAYQSYEEDGSDALAFGIGIDLPIFDRNGGNVSAAKNDLYAARQRRIAAGIALSSELSSAHADLSSAFSRIEALRTKVIPAMEEAFSSAQEGYSQGKFTFLDMLDAQRSLFDAKTSAVDAMLAYHIAEARIHRITGGHFYKVKK